VWRGQEYRKAKPLVKAKELHVPFLSVVRDQRYRLKAVVGNQIPMKLNFQRYAIFRKGGQAKHACFVSGKARGTIGDALMARYTFRRMLRYGVWPGFYKGK